MRRSNNPDQREFTRFVKETEPRLSYALAAAYGMETGVEATADALEWAALDQLSRNQRVAAAMIHGLGYSEREVADLVGMSRWTVRTHLERGLSSLRSTLGVTLDV